MLRNFSYDDINDYAEYADAKAEPIKIKAEKADGAKSKPYDYERYPLGRVAEGLADKQVKVFNLDLNHGFKNISDAKQWAYKNICRVFSAKGMGGAPDLSISRTAIGKYLSSSNVSKSVSLDAHLAALKILPDLISNSVEVIIRPDFNKTDGERSFDNGYNKDVLIHELYGAVNIGGKIYQVRTIVKENVKDSQPDKPYSYEVNAPEKEITEIELLAGQSEVPNEDTSRYSNSSISAANLLKDVDMSYMPGVKVLDPAGIEAANLKKAKTANRDGGLVKPEECALYIPEPAKEGSVMSRRRQREVIDSKEMAVQGALNAAAGAGYQAQNRRGFKYGSTWSEYFVDNANPLARLIHNLTGVGDKAHRRRR